MCYECKQGLTEILYLIKVFSGTLSYVMGHETACPRGHVVGMTGRAAFHFLHWDFFFSIARALHHVFSLGRA